MKNRRFKIQTTHLLILIAVIVAVTACTQQRPKQATQQESATYYFMQDRDTPTNTTPYGNNPASAHTVQSDDARIYYEVYGKGKTVVVLHGGIVGSPMEMHQFIDSLAQNHKVIAISTRGHGQSEMGLSIPSYEQKAKDIKAVLEQEQEQMVTILGFSDGAYTGYQFAKDFPDRIDRLVAIGAGEWKKGFREFNMSYEVLLAADSRYWQQQLALRPEAERMNEWFASINSYYNSVEIGETLFSQVKCPVLVLAGERDENAPLETIMSAYRMLPNATLSIIPNAPHPVFLVNFAAVWASVVPFLNS